MQRIGRGTGGRNTSRHMTALALGCAHGIVIHRHTDPARIMVTRFATTQAAVIRYSGFIGRMTAGCAATRHDQTVIHLGPGKGRGCPVAGGTVLSPDIGMNLIGRGTGGRYTSHHMTALALGCSHGIMVHRHTGPVRITVTRLTTVQAGMVRRASLVRCMTATGGTTRNNKGMIHPGTGKRRG